MPICSAVPPRRQTHTAAMAASAAVDTVCSAVAARGFCASLLHSRPRLCARRSCTRGPMRSGKVSAGRALIRRRMTASAASTAAAGTTVFHMVLPSFGLEMPARIVAQMRLCEKVHRKSFRFGVYRRGGMV